MVMNSGAFATSAPLAPLSDEAGNRSIYLGGIEPTTTSDEILSQVTCGLIDSIKILPEKSCAFISFVDPLSARVFFHEANIGRFVIRDREVKVGWGKPKPLPQEVLYAVENGATRNVFVGGIDDSMTDAFFRKEFERFGEVEHIKVILDKKVAFIHFTSLNSALKCVGTIQKEQPFSRCKVNYGKDRCNKRFQYGPEVHGSLAQQAGMNGTSHLNGAYPANGLNGMNGVHGVDTVGHLQSHVGVLEGFGPGSLALPTHAGRSLPSLQANGAGYPYHHAKRGQYQVDMNGLAGYPHTAASVDPSKTRGPLTGPVSRTVYVGGIDATITAQELCEYVKGGMLDNVKVMPEKNCAFITFVFAEGAQIFYEYASQGFLLKGRQVKVGWGKPSNIPPEVLNAVHRGASRNVYIGNVDEHLTEQRLWEDLSVYGHIESISFVAEKRCAFVSFTSLLSALKAVEGLSVNPKYLSNRVNFGKDACARIPPRAGPTASYPVSSVPSPRGASVSYPTGSAAYHFNSYAIAPSQEAKQHSYNFPGLEQFQAGFGTY